MKKGIHPQLYKIMVHCSCGNEFETYSTVKEVRVEICSQCHPLYTGQQRSMDAAGQIEKFRLKYKKSLDE